MKSDCRQRVLVVVALVGATLASTSLTEPTHAGPLTTSSRRATLATFAGRWLGHTRSLRITRKGYANESIGSGCCDPVIDLKLRLSRPRGTSRNASVSARVTAVRVHDKRAFTKANPAPHVGETRGLRLKHGVITEPLTHTNYCDRAAGRRGTCGV